MILHLFFVALGIVTDYKVEGAFEVWTLIHDFLVGGDGIHEVSLLDIGMAKILHDFVSQRHLDGVWHNIERLLVHLDGHAVVRLLEVNVAHVDSHEGLHTVFMILSVGQIGVFLQRFLI